MQMTSKLEEPGRKAAIINKTKRKDVGAGPGVLAGRDGKDGAWRKAGIQANKKRPGAPRGPLSREERARKRRKGSKRLLTAQEQYTKGDKISDKSSSISLPRCPPAPPPHRHHHPSHQQERERNKSQADHLLLGTGRSGALSSTEAPAYKLFRAYFIMIHLNNTIFSWKKKKCLHGHE